MFERMDESTGNVIGYKVIGVLTKADYEQLLPEVEALIEQEDHIRMLLDMTQFKWAKVEAWGADVKFGKEFKEKIDKLAIVGDKKWEKWLTKVATPFYAGEAAYFHSAQTGEAWTWLAK